MFTIRQIAVAKDFSPSSEQALLEGLMLARRTRASVHLVYVQVIHGDGFDAPVYPSGHQERVTQQLDLALEQAYDVLQDPEYRSIPVIKSILRDVSAGGALIRFARTREIDVVVMGTHGRRGVRRMMMGSVAEEVVRTAECPVLTVLPREEDFIGLPDGDREILLPIDFSSHSETAIPFARELARFFGSKLRVVHVIEETLHPAFYNAGAYSIYDLQPDIEAKALEFLESSYRASSGPEVPVAFEVLTGHAASEIVRVTSERNIGMVVMATHGLTGLAHLLLGSVTERVVRMAACPVFTFKSFSPDATSTKKASPGRAENF